MKIVRPFARLLGVGDAPLIMSSPEYVRDTAMRKIEWCARISHRAEDKQGDESWKRFIKSVVLDHGDWSVVEHVSASVDMMVDRGITHELVRHRLFSFTQESTRFVNYEKKIPPAFIYPHPGVECEWCIKGLELRHYVGNHSVTVWYHPESSEDGEACKYDWRWMDAIHSCEMNYRALLADGWRPQEARSVFPNALAARIIVTGNLRNWRHFFIMRTTLETHPQFRQVSIPLLTDFKSVFPLLFDDIEPNAKQSESMKKAR